MDNTDKQAAKYKSKNLMGFIQDKVDVGMTKLRSDEGRSQVAAASSAPRVAAQQLTWGVTLCHAGVVLDVAILKATIQDEVVPKEKHVRTLKIGCSAAAPRQQVNYVIHGLAKRLEEKKVGWIVTLKTLIVFHRLLREVDPSFQVRRSVGVPRRPQRQCYSLLARTCSRMVHIPASSASSCRVVRRLASGRSPATCVPLAMASSAPSCCRTS